jgi:uroporphyrinogen III methyltransferase/synthase
VKIAAVGPATARPIAERGLTPDLVADEFRGTGIARRMIRAGVRGKNVLLVQAKQANPALREALKKAGAKVTTAEAYRSTASRKADMPKDIDMILFASSLTVENFAKMVGTTKVPAACIGPVTAKTARDLGFRVAVVPKKSTMPALVDTVVAYFQRS